MKTVLTILFIVSFYASNAQCPIPKPIDKKAATGTWNGYYTSGGDLTKVIINIENEDDKLNVSMDIPSMKAKAIDYTTRICDGEELHFIKDDGVTSIEFIGKPLPEGTMNGRVLFRQNGEVVASEVFSAKKS